MQPSRRVAYGNDPSQFGELSLPDGRPWAWSWSSTAASGRRRTTSPSADRSRPPWSSAVGGAQPGVPPGRQRRRIAATLDDVAAGIDTLAEVDGLDLLDGGDARPPAGGHLAAWAASRGRFERWAGGVEVTAVVSQAGVLDLRAAHLAGLGGGAVAAFLGHPPGPEDDPVDPRRQAPLDVPLCACTAGATTPCRSLSPRSTSPRPPPRAAAPSCGGRR